MVRGQYMAGTGMLVQRRKMETVINNITNVETIGYKKDFLVSQSFEDVLIERINDNLVAGNRAAGPLNFGTRVDQIFTAFGQGHFEGTDYSTDVAIAGNGFFVIDTPAGERYTRSGDFVRDNQGYLTDGEGNYVLGTDGRIRLETDEFSVLEDGTIQVDGEYINRLRIVDFEDRNILRKQGSNLFAADGGEAVEAEGYAIKQYFVENSNVETAREMVDMMTVYRAYETNQRMLTMIDETVGKAVNELGRLR